MIKKKKKKKNFRQPFTKSIHNKKIRFLALKFLRLV